MGGTPAAIIGGISLQNGYKTIPFGGAHTYIAHIREYRPGIDAIKIKNSYLNIMVSSVDLYTKLPNVGAFACEP